jgi:DNA-binding response OmpR family regulator
MEHLMRVLHLEDEAALRDILKVALNAAAPELEVLQFISSDDAVRYIEQHFDEVDVFVLDIRVPGKLDGLGVARQIRDLHCHAPIVLTSAYQKPSREILTSLSCEWMAKPWYLVEVPKKLMQLARQV